MTTITGVGPTRSSFKSPNLQHSSSGRMLSLALGPDGARMYTSNFAGVWRSDDAGAHWRQLTRPQLGSGLEADVPGALYATFVFDVAVSPADSNLVLAAATQSAFVSSLDDQFGDGIYRSTDGGASWALVFPTFLFVNQIMFAPDDPMLVYAALGSTIVISQDAGQTWSGQIFVGGAEHIAVGTQEAGGVRRVYAVGQNRIAYSTDGGNTWSTDSGVETIILARKEVADFQVDCQIAAGQPPMPLPTFFSRPTSQAVGSGAHILAIEPGNPTRIYLATLGGANGPRYYKATVSDGTLCNTIGNCESLAGEASLWVGDFSQFSGTGRAQWMQLPGPPVYFGASTPSGNTFVLTKSTSRGFLLFFADNSHVHVSEGTPTAGSWHRLDGKDASAVEQAGQHNNQLLVHVDPHAIVFTPNFEISLKAPSGVTFPFDQNRVLDKHLAGTIWMANDGGVYQSDDGGQTWELSSDGLETLDPVNIAGLYGIGGTPALYIGTGDNDDFFTLDGGKTWKDALSSCGDCDAWFSDVAQRSRVLEFLPRDDGMRVIGFPFFSYPDPSIPAHNHFVRRPRESNVSSGFVLRGFRPIIQTLQNESPLPDGDYVFIGKKSDGSRVLFRTRAISSITTQDDWDDLNKAEQIGPPLPNNADLVQASGGHANPVFYVANGAGNLFKFDQNLNVWKVIVPGGPPGRSANIARKFFVDPYNKDLLYIADGSEIKVSTDGGESWILDPFLQEALTADSKVSLSLNDMLFVRDEPFTRFAFGDSGVFGTINGFSWFTVLNTIALPGKPQSGFFDPVSDPSDRALYVVIESRSILRVGGIPRPPSDPLPVYGLLELAAILEA